MLIARAIKKHSAEKFTIEAIETGLTISAVDDRERHWIKALNSLTPHGYNIESGGNANKVCSQESIQKRLAAMKGRPGKPCSQETKKKIGDANRGRKLNLSQEQRERMSALRKKISWFVVNPPPKETLREWRMRRGKIQMPPHTDEWKQMMREKNSGTKNPFYGRKHSEETKAKISANRKPPVITPELSAKLSAAAHRLWAKRKGAKLCLHL